MTHDSPDTSTRTVPCSDCGTSTEPYYDSADETICPDCIPAPDEITVEKRDEPAEVSCNDCGRLTETTTEGTHALCSECIRAMAAEAKN